MARITTIDQVSSAIENLQSQFSGDIAFAAKNIETGEELTFDASSIFPTASTIKVTILAAVYERLQNGDLTLEERIEMKDSDVVGGSGLLQELGSGVAPSIRDLAMLMIVVSDNTATNMLIDRLGGTDAVNSVSRNYNLNNTVLHNRVDFDLIGDDVRKFAEAPAVELMQFHEQLLLGNIVDAGASAEMMEILRRQQYLDQVPRYLNYRQKSAEMLNPNLYIDLGCKTGFFPGTRVDSGFIILDSKVRIAYCAMAHGSTDGSIAPESEPGIINGCLGKLVVEYWWPGDLNEAEIFLSSKYTESLLSH